MIYVNDIIYSCANTAEREKYFFISKIVQDPVDQFNGQRVK